FRLPNNPSYVHEFCANKQYYPGSCSSYLNTVEQSYGSTNVSACWIDGYIRFRPMENGAPLVLRKAPLGLLKALEWNEWKDYQGIDGVLGLAALHISRRSVRGVSVIPGNNNRVNSDYSLLRWAIFKKKIESPIAIALPPLVKKRFI
ncbi:unnamed protein product, partial [Acanthocheilonema viteae]